MPRISIALMLLALATLGIDAAKPPAIRAQSQPERKPDLDVPFRYEGLMFTDVKVNSSEEAYNFLIDSGASTTVMSTRIADLLKIERFAAGEAKGVGSAPMEIAMDVDIDVAGRPWNDRIIAVLDLSAMANVLGKHMDGIIGADWLMQFERCTFDFLDLRMRCFDHPAGTQPKQGVADMLKGFGGGNGGGLGDLLKGLGGGGGDKPAGGGDAATDELEKQLLEMLKELMPKDKETKEEMRKGLEELRKALDDLLDALEESETTDEDAPPEDIPEESPEESEETEEPFNVAPSYPLLTPPEFARAMLAQDGIDGATVPASLKFKMVEAKVPLLGEVVIVSLWFTEMEVDGRTMSVIFDTGAMPFVVLDQKEADALDLGRSYDLPISGVGSGVGTMGIVNSLKVAEFEEFVENPATVLDLESAFGQLHDNPVMGLLRFFNIEVPKPVGILGLPFALRYRSMTVDYSTMTLSFEPYTDAELKRRTIDPGEETPILLQSVKNTWEGTAGAVGFEAHDLDFELWEAEGIQGGLVIESVEKGSGAEKAGLVKGDIVYAIMQPDPSDPKKEIEAPLRGASSAVVYAAAAGAGDTWTLKVKKKAGGERIAVELTLGLYEGEIDIPERYSKKK